MFGILKMWSQLDMFEFFGVIQHHHQNYITSSNVIPIIMIVHLYQLFLSSSCQRYLSKLLNFLQFWNETKGDVGVWAKSAYVELNHRLRGAIFSEIMISLKSLELLRPVFQLINRHSIVLETSGSSFQLIKNKNFGDIWSFLSP